MSLDLWGMNIVLVCILLKDQIAQLLGPSFGVSYCYVFSEVFFYYWQLSLLGCIWFMVKCSPCKWAWQICMKYKFWSLDRFLEEQMLQHDRAQVVSHSSDVTKIWRLVYSPQPVSKEDGSFASRSSRWSFMHCHHLPNFGIQLYRPRAIWL